MDTLLVDGLMPPYRDMGSSTTTTVAPAVLTASTSNAHFSLSTVILNPLESAPDLSMV